MKPFSRLHQRQIVSQVCPRCEGFIPSNAQRGQYMGALSRHTRKEDDAPIEICSACGNEEAMEQHFENKMTDIKDWPVSTHSAMERLMEAFTSEIGAEDEEEEDF